MQAFIAATSTGKKHQVDEDELPKLMEASATGSACILRRAIILNPNHVVDVYLDDERTRELNERNYRNSHDIKQGTKQLETLEPLPDLFADLRAKLSGSMRMISDKGRTQIQEETGRKGAKI